MTTPQFNNAGDAFDYLSSLGSPSINDIQQVLNNISLPVSSNSDVAVLYSGFVEGVHTGSYISSLNEQSLNGSGVRLIDNTELHKFLSGNEDLIREPLKNRFGSL